LILIVVEVADLERSTLLYQKAFGMTLQRGDHASEDQHGDRWTSGDHTACSWSDGAFLHFALYQCKGDPPTTRAQIGFLVDDLDQAHATAVRAGAELVHAPRREPGTTARYRDYDGNVISLTER
jgi:predicted enzyme related to lactoylglutathione lyase